ncbi:myb-like protein F [Apis florea]|uniref:myb-like protein F n=1 Tax=Apis florea TaxID=7463 RepID=UPI0006297B89|nr:myb-like protein F [Apis florea]XP_012339516.1 myb-like protein F [Apis florea]
MEISPRKPSKRAQEPIDEWLQNEGYFRKHAPRDPTCLFRAVSEQVYMTQYYHIKVRKECVEFMRKMKHLFIESITIPFDDYLEQMTCFTEWGGMIEIQAMSLLYKREFIIFNGQKQISRTVTNNGFKDVIYLCHTPQKQYESIYTRNFVANAAYCQSIVYQILYKDVFQMANIEATVHKMLHDRTASFRHDKFFLKGNLEIRDQLTAEIYNKVGNENVNDEVDDVHGIIKNIPPFPYRIAKALDPNIYRNTDFDIWHEIRREVKNAGWTRHNSHELQIGGKCLVQIDFNEEDFDKTNNNNVYVSSLEKDSNDNNTNVLEKKSNNLIFYYGHIQEMSKNQGPVLVFIEELGEKRIVPYSALKPLPPKKNKMANWLPVCKKNLVLDSNQKWKKTCNTTPRKSKESNINILSNNIDKNESNDNIINNINKNNFDWEEGSLKIDHQEYQEYENYPIEKCPNYSMNNSVDMFSARMIHDDTQSSTVDNRGQENNKEHKEKNSFSYKNSENTFLRNSKSNNVTNDNNAGFNSYSKQRMQKEVYYSPYADSAQMDHMLRSINCSVEKSIDINGSDLPLSDPFTLRFFYNLGLEYFRGGANWNYLTNGQSPGFGQWYQEIPSNEEEITNITNDMMQACALTQQKKEHINDRKEISLQSLCQENGDQYVNGIKNMQIQKTETTSCLPRDKIKEQESMNKESSRLSRNGGPRFKKNSENRHRSTSHFSNQYANNGPNSKMLKSERDTKEDNINIQHSHSIHHQVHNSANALNTYQASYMQQSMYSGLPYYANETEAFANPYYSLNPGFVSIPCLPHSDIHDNSNAQTFPPHLCPGIDYSQAYSGLCPPYLCPSPNPFNLPLQNLPEHWYAVAGQPHYMPYAPVLSVTAETTCNGIQNINQNISS